MEATIIQLASKKLVGMTAEMSMQAYQPAIVWQQFMPQKKTLKHLSNLIVYSLKEYPKQYFDNFNPATPFTFWALAEVHSYNDLPQSFQTFDFLGGLYAQFHFKGTSEDFRASMQFIFGKWLPQSDYTLDELRPHFELLDENYKKDNLISEEIIYIPIKNK